MWNEKNIRVMKRSIRVGNASAWCIEVVSSGTNLGVFDCWWTPFIPSFLKLDQQKKFWKQPTPFPEFAWPRMQAYSTSACTAPLPAQTTPLLPAARKYNLSLCIHSSNAGERCFLQNPRFYFQTHSVSTDPVPCGDVKAAVSHRLSCSGSPQTTKCHSQPCQTSLIQLPLNSRQFSPFQLLK